MASPSAVYEDRKSDDLEIVSVGALYSGSCDKKYGSSSRNFCLISFFFIREKIVSLILWAIKLFELTMGAHIIWRLKKVLKYLCFCCSDSGKLMGVVDSFSVKSYCDLLSSSNSALILWKTVSCAALCTSKRGMAVATHAELLAAENELLAAEGTSVMKENVTHETSQSDQNSKSIILRNPGVIIKIIVLLFGVYRNRCHMQLMLILYKMFKYDWSYVSNLKFSFVYS
ncbi:hypothetical protein HID58_072220 [Brassica napus]|uniref:Uncharacterized protein n=1 Tax=Brassica napus TaxID=3708 RepID=A0ABQ7Z3Z2_BRANA|nr:hypothetical protein HID58_072220 [Brassica napus]